MSDRPLLDPNPLEDLTPDELGTLPLEDFAESFLWWLTDRHPEKFADLFERFRSEEFPNWRE